MLAAASARLSSNAFMAETAIVDTSPEANDDCGYAESDYVAAALGPGWQSHTSDALMQVGGLCEVVSFVVTATERGDTETLLSFAVEFAALADDPTLRLARAARTADSLGPRGRDLSEGDCVVVHIDHLPLASRPPNPDTPWFECIFNSGASETIFKATDPTINKRARVPFDVPFDGALVSPASASGSQIKVLPSELVLALFREDTDDTSTGYYPAEVLREHGEANFEVCFEGDDGECRIVPADKIVRNLSKHDVAFPAKNTDDLIDIFIEDMVNTTSELDDKLDPEENEVMADSLEESGISPDAGQRTKPPPRKRVKKGARDTE